MSCNMDPRWISPLPVGPPRTILRSISPPFRRRLKPLTLFGPPVMIWPHETTSSAVDSSCNIFASRLSLIFFISCFFIAAIIALVSITRTPSMTAPFLRSRAEEKERKKKRNTYGNIMRQREDLKHIIIALAFFKGSICRMKMFLQSQCFIDVKLEMKG